MKPAHELSRIARSQTSLVAFVRGESRFDWSWHYHPDIELTWIRRGAGRRLVGDHAAAYGPGDFVLVGSNLPHTWASAAKSPVNEAVVIQFLPQMLPEALLQIPEFGRVSALLGRAGSGLKFRPQTAENLSAELLALTKEEGMTAWLRLVKILNRLASEKKIETLASSRYRHEKTCRINSRLERVTSYIERNFREEITLAQAARLCGLTPEAFSRFFRRMTGHTFVDFRNYCRVREACRLLSETDVSITEAAYECGFDNLSNFNRRFREARKMTPREYRGFYQRPRQSSVRPRHA